MAQSGTVEFVATDPATQLRGSLAQNAAAYLDLALPTSISAGHTCRSILRGISIESVENLAWELWLFRQATAGAEAIAASTFQGFWSFAAGDGKRIGAAGLYYYYIDGLAVPYETTDAADAQRANLHMALVNRSAAAKTANDAGGIRIQFNLEATLGW